MKRGVDYIGVGIGAVIISSEGKILLAKRGQTAKNERGKWEFPGGTVEFGDTMKDTIIREMKEELNIEIEPILHLPPIDHIIHNDNQHWVTSVFISKITKGKPTIMEPEKYKEIGWFGMAELQKLPLSIATIVSLDILKKLDLQSF